MCLQETLEQPMRSQTQLITQLQAYETLTEGLVKLCPDY